MFQMEGFGSRICHQISSFTFKGGRYKTLHTAQGFLRPRFTITNVTDKRVEKLKMNIASSESGRAPYNFYPAQIIFNDGRIVTNNYQEVEILTESFRGHESGGGYPNEVCSLIHNACEGKLLPKQNDNEKLNFMDRGVNVFLNVNMLTGFFIGARLYSPLINHVALFICERSQKLDPLLYPRYSAQLVYSFLPDLLAMEFEG